MAMRKFCGKGIVVYLGCDSGSMNLQTHTHTWVHVKLVKSE